MGALKDLVKEKRAVASEPEQVDDVEQEQEEQQEAEIEFEPIGALDRKEVQQRYSLNKKVILGDGWKAKEIKRPKEADGTVYCLPLPKEQPPTDEEEERRQAYRRNVVTAKDLRKPTPKVIKNTNRQDLRRRYIFLMELDACKAGFLYYIIPLLIGVGLLIYNIFHYNFWVNAVVATLTLLCAYSCRKIYKSIKSFKIVLGNVLLIAVYITALVLCIIYITGFREQIHIPFTIKLVLIIFDVYYCGKFYAFFSIAYAHDCKLDFGNSVRLNAGKPRSGKTSNGVHDARILALKFWEKLQYDFWDWHSREKEILKRNNADELLEYYEIKTSYNFYVMRPCIPCLFSNIGIEDRNGNRCHKLELAHIKGVKRLPLYTVVFLDEIGAVLKAELSNDKEKRPYDVSDMFRLGGHFLKWAVIACEQDFNNVYIDCRRVVGFNQLINGQEWICRPGLLWWIYNTIKFFISDGVTKKQKRQPRLAHFMHVFESFVRSIGFRRYKFQYVSNTQTKAEVKGANEQQQSMVIEDRGTRVVPSKLCARYSDRAYKQLYASYFDKEIKAELHESLHIRGTDLRYGRQFINSSEAIDEKRQAVDNYIREVS